MCYSIMVAQDWRKLKSDFELQDSDENILCKYQNRVFPHEESVVLRKNGNIAKLDHMTFSLTPQWAKTKKVKWSTYNARLNRTNPKNGKFEKIYEVPTWRDSFNSHNCVVPIASFFESCREGSAKGHEVNFSEEKGITLYAAGIYSQWKGDTETLNSFAILTTDPTSYIKKVGHDRMPIFLNTENSRTWLEGLTSEKKAYGFLANNHENHDFKHSLVRELKT